MARDADVLLEERRRHAERGRDVVEAVDLDLGRQELRGVDVDADEIVHGGRVLGAVQALDRHVAGARHHGVAVDRALEPRDERVDARLLGLRLARRRHQPAAQLAHRGFEHLRLERHGVGAHAFEHEAARGFGRVVAVDAVGLDERPLLLGRGRRAGRCRGRARAAGAERDCAGSGQQMMRERAISTCL